VKFFGSGGVSDWGKYGMNEGREGKEGRKE